MNTEEVRNHDRRFSGDPPRMLTCLAGCREESGKNTRDTRIGGVDIRFAHGLCD